MSETDKAIVKVFKTYTFKLHNLSRSKKAKLDKSMKQSRYTFFFLLKRVEDHANALIDCDKKTRKEGLSSIRKKCAAAVKPLPFSCSIKASNVEDVVAQISSYLELLDIGQNAALPKSFDTKYDYEDALSNLISSTTIEQESQARSDMSKLSKSKLRPLSFYKSRISDGFLLFEDQKGRLFAFLNLWSKNDVRAHKISIDMINTRSGENFRTTTSTGMLLPLECSNWHKEALQKGQSKSSKLFESEGQYYLAVSFQFETERREPTCYLGVDRGIIELASYCVRAESGKVIEKGNLDGTMLREHQRRLEEKQVNDQKLGRRFISGWSHYSDNLVHEVANKIVEIADRNNSQVVIEDLRTLKNGSHHKKNKFALKSGFRKMLTRQQYGKLESMLNYKLSFIGLPKPLQVRAAGTSITCPCCGHYGKENRIKRDIFLCVKCSYSDHADIIGAINIAGKRIWLSKVGERLKNNKNSSLFFKNWQAENLSL